MTIGRLVILCWLAWLPIQTARYAPVWKSELSLWTYAERLAPWLPRTKINLGKAIIASGDRQRGLQVALTGYNLERRRQDAKVAARVHAR